MLLMLWLTASGCAVSAPKPIHPSSGPLVAPSPSDRVPSTSAKRETLFAALEAKQDPGKRINDTVAIVGLDGYARAKTTFEPIRPPYVGNCQPLLPTQAYVAARGVFFLDGGGVVRKLSLDGRVLAVVRFPLTSSQQEISFAVSPDGSRLMGIVLTLPPKPPSPPPMEGPEFLSGDFKLDVYTAEIDGQPKLVRHDHWPQDDPRHGGLQMIGWDASGPLASNSTSYCTQGGRGAHWYGDPVRLDTSGTPTVSLQGPGCNAVDVLPDGTFLCSGSIDEQGGTLSVRRPDGTEVWHYTGSQADSWAYLSPDKQAFVDVCCGVIRRDGSNLKLPIFPEGWLDASTVIGTGDSLGSDMELVRLSAPAAAVDLGFSGTFVGAF